jgi:putative flavoprotein involved in K+ transport
VSKAGKTDVIAVLGGGPAGLAAAATLKPLGLRVRVLEKAEAVGERWRGHYDRLRLHTTRRLSALPGLPLPAAYGAWVARDDFVRYQQAYAAHHGLLLEFGTTVERVERTDQGWRIRTSRGELDAKHVVVGTGYNNAPFFPAWPGVDRFGGEFLHSRQYRHGARYRGKRVLVVGTGNSGAEIASDIAEQGGQVWWSYRTPPNILPRALLGLATQRLGIVLRPLPVAFVDTVSAWYGRLTIGNLESYGLARPSRGLYTAAQRDHVLPILDVGIVAAIRAGRVRPVPAVDSFDGLSVLLSDGQRLLPDAVVACAGYRTALEPLVGHLGVLDRDGVPSVHGPAAHALAPDMYFLGYNNAISGNLREIARHARAIAALIAQHERAVRQ